MYSWLIFFLLGFAHVFHAQEMVEFPYAGFFTADADRDAIIAHMRHGGSCETRDYFGRTLLAVAVGARDFELAQMLLSCGADPNSTDRAGFTPLHRAAFQGGAERITAVLLHHGARVNAQDEVLRTPLYFASRELNVETVEMLLDHGARVTIPDRCGLLPLHKIAVAAARSESDPEKVIRIMRLLLDADPRTAIAQTDAQNTIVHYLCSELSIEPSLRAALLRTVVGYIRFLWCTRAIADEHAVYMQKDGVGCSAYMVSSCLHDEHGKSLNHIFDESATDPIINHITRDLFARCMEGVSVPHFVRYREIGILRDFLTRNMSDDDSSSDA